MVASLDNVLNDDELRRAYRNYLWREPDPAGKHAWLGKAVSRETLSAALMGSAEHRTHVAPILERIRADTSPKVLLFGAYGNGNLGDDIQADALAELVMAAVPKARLYATSCFDGEYPFESGEKLRRGAIYSHVLLSEFDLLIIGGGGLLAHPHEPLADGLWANDLTVRTVFFGVGVHGSFVAEAALAIRKAALLGCRDASSLEWASAHTPEIALTLDPVLLSRTLAPHAPTEESVRQYHRCWIVRDPIDDIVESIRDCAGANDVIVGLEPAIDSVLRQTFPDICFVSSLNDAWKVICASEVVISMRYHGVILSMLAGVSTYALRIPKADRLLELLGQTDRILTELDDFTPDLTPITIDAQLGFWRQAGITHLASQFRCLTNSF